MFTQFDKKELQDWRWINDKHVNYAQFLLKNQLPHIDGLRLTLLAQKEQKKIKNGVQIIHSHGYHWIVASTLSCIGQVIKVFGSLYTIIDKDTKDVIQNLFHTNGKLKIEMITMFKQKGRNDYRLFAFAIATALVFGSNPVHFQQSGMREHLSKCFEDGL